MENFGDRKASEMPFGKAKGGIWEGISGIVNFPGIRLILFYNS
jgi:hypothetical protein